MHQLQQFGRKLVKYFDDSVSLYGAIRVGTYQCLDAAVVAVGVFKYTAYLFERPLVDDFRFRLDCLWSMGQACICFLCFLCRWDCFVSYFNYLMSFVVFLCQFAVLRTRRVVLSRASSAYDRCVYFKLTHSSESLASPVQC